MCPLTCVVTALPIHLCIYSFGVLYIVMMINICILGRTYFVERSIHSVEEHWLLGVTGVQASGVIIDHLLRQCCFVWFEIVGPNNNLSYVHQQSNHPSALLKNILLNISKRLTSISSSKEVFDESIASYQKALTESGYDHELTYNPPQEKALKNKRKRTRNITWYNSPFNSNVRTNFGEKFLHVVDKCFPKNHPLHKIFNRHKLKLSYLCMPNIKSVISSHKYVLSNFNSRTQQPDAHNCRKKPDSRLKGKCLQSNVIYQTTVSTATTTETFFGLATNLMECYRNHQSSFWCSNRRNETELSKYIWTLQYSNKPFQIKWKVLKKCKAYSNISKKCNLCLYEKFIIICKKELCSLNRRNELASSCPHRNRYVLQNSRVT